MLYDFSGRSANYTIESGTFRSRSKVCRQERQNARLESRRRQDAAGFNSQGFGVRLTGPGAHCGDVLQFRPSERSTENSRSPAILLIVSNEAGEYVLAIG
jgi:hypothetical protein